MTRFLQLLPTRTRIRIFRAQQAARDVSSVLRDGRFRGPRETHGDLADIDGSPLKRAQTSNPVSDLTLSTGSTSITFAHLGQTIQTRPDETILAAALRQDVDLLYSCTLGGCAACMLRLVDGEVGYDDPESLCLTDEDFEEGYILACVAKPIGAVTLEEP